MQPADERDLSTAATLRAYSRAMALMVALGGSVVLAGWLLDIPSLKSIAPGLVTMKVNTALGFVLAGLALRVIAAAEERNPSLNAGLARRRLGQCCGLLLAALGMLTLSEYAVGWDLGIDQLLIRVSATGAGETWPGRMSAAGASGFVLLGFCLLALASARSARVQLAQALASIVCFIGLLSLLGYAYGVESLYLFAPFSAMALHSALLFLLAGSAALWARPDVGLMSLISSAGVGGAMLRRLLPAGVAVPMLLGALVEIGEQAELYGPQMDSALMVGSLIAVFSALFWATGRRLQRLDLKRSEAEGALRQSNSRFDRLAQSGIIGTVVADTAGRIIDANDAFLELVGYTRAELLAGQVRWDTLTPPEHRHVSERITAQLRTRGTSALHEKEYLRKDGRRVAVLLGVALLDGSEDLCIAYVLDITQRRQAQERIEAQARLLELAQDAIQVNDLQGHIQFWNRGAERLYGWPSNEVAGRSAEDLFGAARGDHEAAHAGVLTKGEWRGEIQRRTKGGQPVLVSSRWNLLRGPNGQPKAVLVIDTDITGKKKLEAQFLRAQRMEAIGTLASGIAHDLNNILAPISMAASLLSDSVTGAAQREFLTMIERSAQRGAAVVKQLLNFGRGVEGERVPVQPGLLLKELTKIVKETFPRNLTVEAQTPADLWSIKADLTQVHQVLLNLCVNARDAMPDGGTLQLAAHNVRLDDSFISAHAAPTAGPYVCLSVTDTGHGIPSEIIDCVFDPFFTTKELGKGSGLGLSTVLSIAKGHGGFVNVYSEPGRGTTFKVYFPALRDEETAPAAPTPSVARRGCGELILVVDDEDTIRDSTQRILERHGYTVITVPDGVAAVGVYAQRHHEVKLVLTDLMMPKMGGGTLARALRNINPAVKLIAFSGLSHQETETELLSSGIAAFVPKPYRAENLLAVVGDVLHGKA
ncbi:MAG: PAS domain S-box protein [Verrucomicrobia bacterium]|nr:PAS domain S-box protein [Verrucomicrobiota bacterium]